MSSMDTSSADNLTASWLSDRLEDELKEDSVFVIIPYKVMIRLFTTIYGIITGPLSAYFSWALHNTHEVVSIALITILNRWVLKAMPFRLIVSSKKGNLLKSIYLCDITRKTSASGWSASKNTVYNKDAVYNNNSSWYDKLTGYNVQCIQCMHSL